MYSLLLTEKAAFGGKMFSFLRETSCPSYMVVLASCRANNYSLLAFPKGFTLSPISDDNFDFPCVSFIIVLGAL